MPIERTPSCNQQETCGFFGVAAHLHDVDGDSYTECGASSIGGILIKCYTEVQFLPLGPKFSNYGVLFIAKKNVSIGMCDA